MESGSASTVQVAPALLGEALVPRTHVDAHGRRPLRLGGEEAIGRTRGRRAGDMAESLTRHGQLTSVTAFAPAPNLSGAACHKTRRPRQVVHPRAVSRTDTCPPAYRRPEPLCEIEVALKSRRVAILGGWA